MEKEGDCRGLAPHTVGLFSRPFLALCSSHTPPCVYLQEARHGLTIAAPISGFLLQTHVCFLYFSASLPPPRHAKT